MTGGQEFAHGQVTAVVAGGLLRLECSHGTPPGKPVIITTVAGINCEYDVGWDELAAKVREHQVGHGCAADAEPVPGGPAQATSDEVALAAVEANEGLGEALRGLREQITALADEWDAEADADLERGAAYGRTVPSTLAWAQRRHAAALRKLAEP